MHLLDHFVLHFVEPALEKPRKLDQVIDKVKGEVAKLALFGTSSMPVIAELPGVAQERKSAPKNPRGHGTIYAY